MNRIVTGWLLAVTLLFSGCGNADTPDPGEDKRQDLRVMTFNVLCSFCGDKDYDSWKQRVPHLQGLIAEHDADLVGLQELTWAKPDNDEVKLMIDKHPVYTPLYYISPGGEMLDHFPDSTLYFRTERFERIDHGFYWLSETPDKAFTVGWVSKAQFPRIVAWAVLRDKWTKRELLFVGSHFDPNTPNQTHSAPLLLARTVEKAASRPVIVVGDFNSRPDTDAYAILTEGKDPSGLQLVDTHEVADELKIHHNTDKTPDYETTKRIDHIFAAGKNLKVQRWLVDLQRFGDKDRHPSDHRLMMATLTL